MDPRTRAVRAVADPRGPRDTKGKKKCTGEGEEERRRRKSRRAEEPPKIGRIERIGARRAPVGRARSGIPEDGPGGSRGEVLCEGAIVQESSSLIIPTSHAMRPWPALRAAIGRLPARIGGHGGGATPRAASIGPAKALPQPPLLVSPPPSSLPRGPLRSGAAPHRDSRNPKAEGQSPTRGEGLHFLRCSMFNFPFSSAFNCQGSYKSDPPPLPRAAPRPGRLRPPRPGRPARRAPPRRPPGAAWRACRRRRGSRRGRRPAWTGRR